MTKPTTSTTITCQRTTVNNVPPSKRTQERVTNSHGTNDGEGKIKTSSKEK